MRQRTDQERLKRFFRTLGRRFRKPVRFYLVGGSVMIDLGLRSSTLDIVFLADADDPTALNHLEQVIRALKNELDVNVEPASPADFLPIPSYALDRSRYIGRYGPVSIYYDHLQAR